MSGYFASHAGLIELTLFEGIVVALACWELWSVRRSLRRDRKPDPPAQDEGGADRSTEAER